jgi:hypothetical protein
MDKILKSVAKVASIFGKTMTCNLRCGNCGHRAESDEFSVDPKIAGPWFKETLTEKRICEKCSLKVFFSKMSLINLKLRNN